MLRPSPYGWISQYFFGFFTAYGVYLPFWALWFSHRGVNATDIGLLVGLGLATRCLANILITPRVHKSTMLMPALRWVSLGGMLFIGLHFFVGDSFWMLALATVLFNTCCGPIIPLSDSVANYYARLKLLDYGRTRLWGSIAFICGSTLVGYLVAGFGTDMILYTALVAMALTVLLSLRTPAIRPQERADGVNAPRPKLMSLLRQRPVVLFLVLVSLLQGSHAAYYSISTIYWKQAGYSTDVIGYLWSLGVVSEVAIFALSARVFARASLRTLFVISALGVMLRWGLTASTTSVLALVLIQLLHGLTYALAHLAAILYIQRTPGNQMVALQALYNALPLGAFTALMTALSGWMYESWGGNVFWVMALMGLLALFIKTQPMADPDRAVKPVQS